MGYKQQPVKFVDAQRAYVQLMSDSWTWKRLTQSNVDNLRRLSIELLPQDKQPSSNHIVVKYFARRNDGYSRVYLSMIGKCRRVKSPSLVIVKELPCMSLSEKELRLWQLVNECTNAYTTTLNQCPVLCMPLAIYAKENSLKHVSFFLI